MTEGGEDEPGNVPEDELPNLPHIELDTVGHFAIAKIKEAVFAVTGE